jgi:hypothetical protein
VKALVLSVGENSQIHALDRSQRGLLIKKDDAGTMTHDYKRNGTKTLFAALNMLDGKVIGCCMPPPRNTCRFLQHLDREIPAKARPESHPRQLRHPQDPSHAVKLKPIEASTCTSVGPLHRGST